MEQFHYFYQNAQANISLEQMVYRIGSYHYNWHPELEFLVVLRGEIEMCSQAACHILQEDDLILINPNSGHATFSREPESIAMVLHASPRFFSGYYEDAEKLYFRVCSDASSRNSEPFRALRRELAGLAQNLGGDDPARRLAADCAFYRLMQCLTAEFPPERMSSASFQADEKKLEAMDSILKYLHKNYRKKISLDAIAKASGYNASYFSQLFKSNLGINFYDYLTRIRLREATRELSQTDKRIVDIAMDYGFADLKSFNAAFRKTFRKSPTEYRRQLNEEHIRIDEAFKKVYLPVDDALLHAKLTQYRGEGEASAPKDSASCREALCLQMRELLDEAQALAAHIAQLDTEFSNNTQKDSQ